MSSLSLFDRNLTRLPDDLSARLQILDIPGNQISRLEKLPAGLQELDISYNRISRLENLPAGLQILNISYIFFVTGHKSVGLRICQPNYKYYVYLIIR
jgi:Leucine-rich repeat (LRR) protein